METELEGMERRLRETKEQLESIRKQTKEEKKARAMASFKVTENIANERESLVKQLDNLRLLNQKLKDERDAVVSVDPSPPLPSSPPLPIPSLPVRLLQRPLPGGAVPRRRLRASRVLCAPVTPLTFIGQV